MSSYAAKAEETARRQAAEAGAVLDYLSRTLSGVDRERAQDLLDRAGCAAWPSIRQIAESLDRYPDPLRIQSGERPAAVRRLAFRLHADGFEGVVPPRCAHCSGIRARLSERNPDGPGHLCSGCAQRTRTGECPRCRRTVPVVLRAAEGLICKACYDRDPARRERCGQCGELRSVAVRTGDGAGYCRRCRPRPDRCHRCGRQRPVAQRTEQGAVCDVCYRPPSARCDQCGRIRPVHRRGSEHGPTLCAGCYRGPTAICSSCGRTRPCRNAATDTPLCAACVPKPLVPCHRCGRERPAAARWPIGAVCQVCYRYVRDHPAPCPTCATIRPLISLDENGAKTCGPCGGLEVDHACMRCGAATSMRNHGRCEACHLSDELESLATSAANQPNHAQIRALADALADSGRPATILAWLRRGRSVHLLLGLVKAGGLITHASLDALAPSKAVDHVRELLIAARILPVRDEHLDRIEPWLGRLLADRPSPQTTLVRAYALWFILHRARLRSSEGRSSAATGATVRARIRAALCLLDDLHREEIALEGLSQQRLEAWLLAHPGQGPWIRPFIAWSNARRLTRALSVPDKPRPEPDAYLGERDLARQLYRCLDASRMPLHLGVAGALTLLYGLPISKIARLTRQDVITDSSGTSLRAGARAVPLPPRLAEMIVALAARPAVDATVARLTPPTRWLLPGRTADRPIHPATLHIQLRRHGVTPRPGRNSALAALACDLPTPVLADATGLALTTATQWTRRARRDAIDYIAARRNTSNPGHAEDPAVRRH